MTGLLELLRQSSRYEGVADDNFSYFSSKPCVCVSKYFGFVDIQMVHEFGLMIWYFDLSTFKNIFKRPGKFHIFGVRNIHRRRKV